MGVLHVDRLHWWLHTLELLEYKAKSERTENKTGETLVVLLLPQQDTPCFENMDSFRKYGNHSEFISSWW